MNGPRIDLTPDTRKRRISAGERWEDAGEEYAESRFPTVRVFRDSRGPCLIVDGVPFRSREAFRDDRDRQAWSFRQTDYAALGEPAE